MENDIFKVEVSEYVKRCNRLQANLEESYTLILGQCNELTRMQLEGVTEWEATYDIYDVIRLLKMIKSLENQSTDQIYHPLPLY